MNQALESVIKRTSKWFHPDAFSRFQKTPNIVDLPLAEQLSLFSKCGINLESNFFRDKQVLKILDTIIIPSYAKGEPLNIASVGCSVGFEPYSLLVKYWNRREEMRIDGFDSNVSAIEAALDGEYPQMDYSGKFAPLVFVKETDNPHIKKIKFTPEAKKHVTFQVHDLLDSSLPQKYDVILLLNVLYHYSEDGRKRMLENIVESMRTGAWLLCESDTGEPRYVDYEAWMKDLSNFNLEKQTMVLPSYFMSDQTSVSNIYRKID